MKARIFSKIDNLFVRRNANGVILAWLILCSVSQVYCTSASAQAPASNSRGLFTDPQTGIVYRQVSKTVERPVIETKVEKQNQTVYRPEIVTETKPENRTVYTPVVEYKWQPRLHGRWNPFQQPTVAYHHVPETRWEARNQVVNRTESRTKWIAETSAQSAIAARLRPLDSNARVTPLNPSHVATTRRTPVYSAPSYRSPQIAASTIGRMTSDPPRRSAGQSGMRANDLYPTSQVHGHALPPASGGVGVARLPSLPFMR